MQLSETECASRSTRSIDLNRLCVSPLALVAAHPDDETASAGWLLTQLRRVTILHATDGAPRDMQDALAAGFSTRRDYARARRAEFAAALAFTAVDDSHTRNIGLVDQEASDHLVELSLQLAAMLRDIQPQWVITHPYEGGHPDHDATAFAVHAAVRMLEVPPDIVEMTSYYNRNGQIRTFDFLHADDCPPVTHALSPAECSRKRKMFECFQTQRRVLNWFPISIERFRAAPEYDFTLPPHAGKLYYEYFDWGMTGERWRWLARIALDTLDIRGRI
jgi:LmbE family N-acetylglucosaminyl deacetylase